MRRRRGSERGIAAGPENLTRMGRRGRGWNREEVGNRRTSAGKAGSRGTVSVPNVQVDNDRGLTGPAPDGRSLSRKSESVLETRNQC